MTSVPGRVAAVDVARALAIWSMFVAHTAPSGGPLRLLNLSEYLTAPLFAALVGAGAVLAGARSTRVPVGPEGLRRSRLPAAVIRGGLLVALGVALPYAGAQVVIVLVHLGVLTVLVVPLVRLPTRGVIAVGLTAFALSPPLMTAGRAWQARLWAAETPVSGPVSSLVDVVATGSAYRLTAFLVWACAGIVLTRLLIAPAPSPAAARTAVPVIVTAASSFAVAGMFAAHKAGLFDLAPYAGTHAELVFDTLMVTAVLSGCFLVVGRLPRTLARALGAVGQMALTHYCLQVLALAAWVRWIAPRDDSWWVLSGLLIGSVVVTAVWRALVRRDPWRRGPVEGGADALVALSRHPSLRSQPTGG